MGLFTSLCKKCDSPITWFGPMPNGINCGACGEHMNDHELLQSFMAYHLAYQKVMSLYNKKTKEEMLATFSNDKYAMTIIQTTYWPETDPIEHMLAKVASMVNIDFIGKDSFHDDAYCAYCDEIDVNYVWNPLEDNGTAFSVMVASGVSVMVDHEMKRVVAHTPTGLMVDEFFGDDLSNEYPSEAATRKAIVNAVVLMYDMNQ